MRISTPETSRARKAKVMSQCVTRTTMGCRGRRTSGICEVVAMESCRAPEQGPELLLRASPADESERGRNLPDKAPSPADTIHLRDFESNSSGIQIFIRERPQTRTCDTSTG